MVLWLSHWNIHYVNKLNLSHHQVAFILKKSPITADQYAVQSFSLKLLDNFYCSYNYNIYSFFGVITDAHSSSTWIFQNHLNINLKYIPSVYSSFIFSCYSGWLSKRSQKERHLPEDCPDLCHQITKSEPTYSILFICH